MCQICMGGGKLSRWGRGVSALELHQTRSQDEAGDVTVTVTVAVADSRHAP